MRTSEDQKIIEYLLGNITEDEQASFEERLFASDEFYEQLQAVKAELADDYVRGELSAADRETFSRRFLATPENREQAAFARVMAKSLPEILSDQRAQALAQTDYPAEKSLWWQSLLASIRAPAWQYWPAAAAILLAFGAFWMFSANRRLQAELDRARAEQAALQRQQQEQQRQTAEQRARNEELAARLQREQAERERLEKEKEQAQSMAEAIPAFILSPGLIRSTNEPEKLIVPRRARRINLQMDLGGDDQYGSFRAELRTARGNLVWSRNITGSQSTPLGKVVSLKLPAALLPNGEYELTLKGIVSRGQLKDIGYYYFSVAKR